MSHHPPPGLLPGAGAAVLGQAGGGSLAARHWTLGCVLRKLVAAEIIMIIKVIKCEYYSVPDV